MQQGVGGTEGGAEVDGSASRLGATPNVIVQNEPMHPQPLHHRPPRELEKTRHAHSSYLIIMLLSLWPPKVCMCAHRHGEMFALGPFDGHTTDE